MGRACWTYLKRVSRVQTFVIEVQVDAAAELVSARSGENINAARWLIVFRRKRVLVDANLAN